MLKGIVRFVEAGEVRFTFLQNIMTVSQVMSPTGNILRVYYGANQTAEFTANQFPKLELFF